MRQASVTVYWSLAGEVMTVGGTNRIAHPDQPAIGCRPVAIERAAELLRFYRAQQALAEHEDARGHCRRRASELTAALTAVRAWRRCVDGGNPLAAGNKGAESTSRTN